MIFYKMRSFWLTFLITFLVGLVLVTISMLLAWSLELVAWLNAFVFAAILLFGFCWIIFAATKGVFDVFTYFAKKLFFTFRRDKVQESFYDYRQRHTDATKEFYLGYIFATCVFLIVAVVLAIQWQIVYG